MAIGSTEELVLLIGSDISGTFWVLGIVEASDDMRAFVRESCEVAVEDMAVEFGGDVPEPAPGIYLLRARFEDRSIIGIPAEPDEYDYGFVACETVRLEFAKRESEVEELRRDLRWLAMLVSLCDMPTSIHPDEEGFDAAIREARRRDDG